MRGKDSSINLFIVLASQWFVVKKNCTLVVGTTTEFPVADWICGTLGNIIVAESNVS